MSTSTTPVFLADPRRGVATPQSRAQAALVALLACGPLPVLSLGAMLLPVPQLAERAAVAFAPLVPFVDGSGGHVVRERAAMRAPVTRVAPVASAPAEGEASARELPARNAARATANASMPATTSRRASGERAAARTHAAAEGPAASDPEPTSPARAVSATVTDEPTAKGSERGRSEKADRPGRGNGGGAQTGKANGKANGKADEKAASKSASERGSPKAEAEPAGKASPPSSGGTPGSPPDNPGSKGHGKP